ncbi:hypothetical protein BGZ94_002872 [Podila epigama]|nr:hypothetical protein BGZ94_002872 [Podila epigama]
MTTEYAIVTRFAIQNFFFSGDSENLEEVKTLADQIAEEFDMGDVIKIDIPRFRYGKRQAFRNEFIFYTRGENSADSRIPRPYNKANGQDRPVKIGWTGAPAYCTYCKTDGHLNQNCPDRLSRTCNACNTPGHISAQCSRFGERDREAARRRAKTEGSLAATPNPPVTTSNTATTVTPPATAPPPTRPSSPCPSDQSMDSWGDAPVPDEDGATDQKSVENTTDSQDLDVPTNETPTKTMHQPPPTSHPPVPPKL